VSCGAAYERLYAYLQSVGYICIFKPTMTLPDGTVKGNVDAELVLHTMIEYPNYDRAVIVSGDGDFHCLVSYLLERDKLACLLVPNAKKCSKLLKSLSNSGRQIINHIADQRNKMEKRRR
jgi:Uncharacterized conserved protein